jgi:hypothetical protein
VREQNDAQHGGACTLSRRRPRRPLTRPFGPQQTIERQKDVRPGAEAPRPVSA